VTPHRRRAAARAGARKTAGLALPGQGQRRYVASWAEHKAPGGWGAASSWIPVPFEKAKATLIAELQRNLGRWAGRGGSDPARYSEALDALRAAAGPVTIDLPGHVLSITEARTRGNDPEPGRQNPQPRPGTAPSGSSRHETTNLPRSSRRGVPVRFKPVRRAGRRPPRKPVPGRRVSGQRLPAQAGHDRRRQQCRFLSFMSRGTSLSWPDTPSLVGLSSASFSSTCHFPRRPGLSYQTRRLGRGCRARHRQRMATPARAR